MKLVLRAARPALCAAVFAAVGGGCYTGGGGTDPPTSEFYFPVGLAVSTGGNVLYAVNSDFDLQWNGGTLQSYDLHKIRHDAVELTGEALGNLQEPTQDLLDNIVNPALLQWPCMSQPALPTNNGTSIGLELGTNCAPPFNSAPYQTFSAIIGAFATDLQLSLDGTRLFAPVRGNATVTWADVASDSATMTAPAGAFVLDCGQGPSSGSRCASSHETGNDPNSIANTRNVTMPGEPFGLAQSEDGTVMVVTSQTNTEASLLTTGFAAPGQMLVAPAAGNQPSMQYVASNLDNGGNGIVAIPHDPDVVVAPTPSGACPPLKPGQVCAAPAFLQTSRAVPNLDLLRYTSDDGSTLHRPFLNLESRIPITSVSGGGTDSRGIAIDTTQRIACKLNGGDPIQCGQIPARIFFANRSANVLAYGTVGNFQDGDENLYNPDLVTLTGNYPIGNQCSPSRVYIAPIVDTQGQFAVRVFVICFDGNQLVIYDPNANTAENFVNVGLGPYAMAFDPFDLNSVAAKAIVPLDPRYMQDTMPVSIRTYRYAYLASFTDSYVQVIDLDGTSPTTFEQVVFTLGQPTPPKGQ